MFYNISKAWHLQKQWIVHRNISMDAFSLSLQILIYCDDEEDNNAHFLLICTCAFGKKT